MHHHASFPIGTPDVSESSNVDYIALDLGVNVRP
jgi:hypothetical protein